MCIRDSVQTLRRAAKREMLAESHKYSVYRLLCSIPYLGPVRTSILIARVQVPNRFRTKRQFWAYCGLALETRNSAEYRFVKGQLQRSKKPVFIRGLNLNHLSLIHISE